MASLKDRVIQAEYDKIIKDTGALIVSIKPNDLKDYLNNYDLLFTETNNNARFNLKVSIGEYIKGCDLENIKIEELENKIIDINTNIIILLKKIENKTGIYSELTSLKNKLGHFILGLRIIKDKDGLHLETLGGGKYKMHGKKEILGKMRCIYKKAGDRKDRKEYIKHKGNFITLRKFREYNKQKK